MKIYSAGQSCFRITLADGRVLFTDPWLGPSIIKPYETPIKASAIERCDFLLVSHPHIDHVDSTAFKMAKRLRSTVVGPPSVARKATAKGITNTVTMSPGDTKDFSGFKVTATHAFHPLTSDPIGFVLEADKTVYFSGDTRLDDRVIADLNKFNLDIAMLQIACAVYFFKKDGMDIPDAAKMARAIKPKIAIPMHYNDRFRQPNPREFGMALDGSGIRVDIIDLGEEKEY